MATDTLTPELGRDARATPSLTNVIVTASGGTLIEWYDFYLYAIMGVYLGRLFFPDSTKQGLMGTILSMGILGIGFVIRPLGGIVFGSLADRVGRKYSFLFTLLLMGAATTAMGLVPTYGTIGYAAPLSLLVLRIVQGLALGGEVGGAVSYVVENSPDRRRGWYLGILYAMSPLGTLVALAVVALSRTATGPEMFDAWGWRIPFLLSGVLVVVSMIFRMRLQETAAFEALRRSRQTAQAPARELVSTRENITRLLLGVFGSTAGQGALGLTSVFFSANFMQAVLKLDIGTASSVSLVAVSLALPCYLLFGWLSDHVGRRPMIIAGMLYAVVFYVPIYYGMTQVSSPPQFWMLVLFNWLQIVAVAAVLAPTMASLAELFPTRLRSTGIGIAYNVSNGVLNGFAPLIGFALIASTGNSYASLAYPLALALITAVVSLLFVKETYRSPLP